MLQQKWPQRKIILLITLIYTFSGSELFSQTPYLSQDVIKYNISTHSIEEGKKIPFDKSFTLIIKNISGTLVESVEIFEAKIDNGKRMLQYNNTVESEHRRRCKTCSISDIEEDTNTPKKCQAIADKRLKFTPDTTSLNIYVDPLKPNRSFDILVHMFLSKSQMANLDALNWQLYLSPIDSSDIKTKETARLFQNLKKELTDKSINRTAFSYINFQDYRAYFDSNIKTFYDQYKNTKFNITDALTAQEFDAIIVNLQRENLLFPQIYTLNELTIDNKTNEFCNGTIEVSQEYSTAKKCNIADGSSRLKILSTNQIAIDTLIEKIKLLKLKGYNSITSNHSTYPVDPLLKKIRAYSDSIKRNKTTIEFINKELDGAINRNREIRYLLSIAQNTISSDLKTAGSSVLFIDLGMTNIFVKDLSGNFTYIPRLYTGVSVYFRPIDKSTRRNSFPKKSELCTQCTCEDSKNGGYYDYGVIATKTVWQHLCLNVGITWGTIPNKDFENFYSNSSLLIGPAWRFKRAFKVSSGLALLKRTSQDPTKSDKEVVPGFYFSLSADFDFLQAIKDITQKFF